MIRGNELVIRPARINTDGEFAEQIFADLISQGYSGNELLDRFRKVQSEMRPAVEAMIMEAKRGAASESEYETYDDIFEVEEKL